MAAMPSVTAVAPPCGNGGVNLRVRVGGIDQQGMRVDAHADGELVDVVDARVDLGALERSDVGALQAAFERELLLRPAKQRARRAQVGGETVAGRSLSIDLGHLSIDVGSSVL